jgi:hypothetical protein
MSEGLASGSCEYDPETSRARSHEPGPARRLPRTIQPLDEEVVLVGDRNVASNLHPFVTR